MSLLWDFWSVVWLAEPWVLLQLCGENKAIITGELKKNKEREEIKTISKLPQFQWLQIAQII